MIGGEEGPLRPETNSLPVCQRVNRVIYCLLFGFLPDDFLLEPEKDNKLLSVIIVLKKNIDSFGNSNVRRDNVRGYSIGIPAFSSEFSEHSGSGMFYLLFRTDMKKGILFVSVCLFLLACHSNTRQSASEERFPPEQRVNKMWEQLEKELELTAPQQEELKAWFKSAQEKRKKLLEGKKEDRKNRREIVRRNREEMREELKKILTEEQFLKYEKFEKESRMERGNPKKGSHRSPRFIP